MVKTECFYLRLGTRKGFLLSSFLCDAVLEILASAINQEKKRKSIQIEKEEIKLFLFANSKKLTKNFSIVSDFSKATGYKVSTKKLIVCFILAMDNLKQIKNTIPIKITGDRKVKYTCTGSVCILLQNSNKRNFKRSK